MSTMSEVTTITMSARADLSGKIYHIVRKTAAAQCDMASAAGVAQTDIMGVLQNKPKANQAAAVGIFGETKVVAGAAITQGVLITTNGSGRAIAASSGDWTVGQAMTAAAADGEQVRALLRLPAVRLTY